MSGVLILDNTYRPLRYDSYAKAVKKIVKEKVIPFPNAPILVVYETSSTVISIPSILVLKITVPIPKKASKKVSAVLLYARDNYTCQYCGRHKNELRKGEMLTKEHIIPSSKFSRKEDANTWENMVTACSTCNHKKGNKLPQECNMHPIKTPIRPREIELTIYSRYDSQNTEQRDFVDMYHGKRK